MGVSFACLFVAVGGQLTCGCVVSCCRVKLANRQLVMEVDLILAPQYGQHTRVVVAVSH